MKKVRNTLTDAVKAALAYRGTKKGAGHFLGVTIYSPAAITFRVPIQSRNYILGIALYLQKADL
jgi:hypothetical protein